jgi:hypothetical protein
MWAEALVSHDNPLDPHHYGHLNWRAPLARHFETIQVCQAQEVLGHLRERERIFLFECLNQQGMPPGRLRERLAIGDRGHLFLHFTTDDDWQFEIFSRFMCQYYHVVTTNNPHRSAEYAAFGKPAVFLQYACNQEFWRHLDVSKRYDVTFIGQPHSDRYQATAHLLAKGIAVRVFGAGWDRHAEMRSIWGGYLSAEDVVRVMNESRICLNFLAASTRDQMAIKARLFEINGCGSFQLCSAFDEVGRYYEIGKEVEVFHDLEDLTEKIRYYLAHEQEREAIARAGHERTLREHTWDARYDHLFREIERLRPHLPEVPQPTISEQRVAVLYLARRGQLSPATVASLNAQTLPNITVIIVSDRPASGAEGLARPLRQVRPAEVKSLDPDADLVAFIEDGDTWEPEKLQFQAFALEQDAPKGIALNLAQWGAGRDPQGDELAAFVLRWLRDNHGHDDLVPRGAIPSALVITAKLFREEQELAARFLLQRDGQLAARHFPDRTQYSHIELGVPLVRVPEQVLWDIIASLRGQDRLRWINSALRFRSARYIPLLLRRLRLRRAWLLWRAYQMRRARASESADGRSR